MLQLFGKLAWLVLLKEIIFMKELVENVAPATANGCAIM